MDFLLDRGFGFLGAGVFAGVDLVGLFVEGGGEVVVDLGLLGELGGLHRSVIGQVDSPEVIGPAELDGLGAIGQLHRGGGSSGAGEPGVVPSRIIAGLGAGALPPALSGANLSRAASRRWRVATINSEYAVMRSRCVSVAAKKESRRAEPSADSAAASMVRTADMGVERSTVTCWVVEASASATAESIKTMATHRSPACPCGASPELFGFLQVMTRILAGSVAGFAI